MKYNCPQCGQKHSRSDKCRSISRVSGGSRQRMRAILPRFEDSFVVDPDMLP